MPGFTSTEPVARLKVSCGGTVDPVATVSTALIGVAGVPLIRSPLSTLVTASAPEAPFTPATVSGVATRVLGTVVTETVAVLQLVGLIVSQI